MKRKFVTCIALILILACCPACGYNALMREYLSDPENYYTGNVVFVDAYYYDDIVQTENNRKYVRDSDVSTFIDHEVTIDVRFETEEDFFDLIGFYPAFDADYLKEFEFLISALPPNNKILCENGFYENVSAGDKISIRTSNWIYMDTEFRFLAYVECNGVVYLNFEEGLANIVNFMNEHKSLL